MSSKVTILMFTLCLFVSLTSVARIIKPHSATNHSADKQGQHTDKKPQSASHKVLLSEPCSITFIEFKIAFAANTVACPGKRPVPVSSEAEIKVGSTGDCVLGDNPTVLELSDAAGNFTNPVILLEAPLLTVGSALARVTEVPGQPTYAFPKDTPPWLQLSAAFSG